MTNTRQLFYPVEEIISEVAQVLAASVSFDVISIVGEGEPTLYLGLGDLIDGIKSLTDKPVVVITNAALFYDENVRNDCIKADIVLPSMDGFDVASWKKIDRPYGKLDFDDVFEGLVQFSKEYSGQLWLEIMLVDTENTSDDALQKLSFLAGKVRHDRLYINTPIRPPAEDYVVPVSKETAARAAEILDGTAIDFLSEGKFSSDIQDDYEALKSIISRHPMNRFEIESFLSSRGSAGARLYDGEQHTPATVEKIFRRLNNDKHVTATDFAGIVTYRAN
ncbi:MAG: radical SAM protein [Treponema sp.]|jgi:wyosine [tRNA(Phe)-imidazoG37] synthetase (radical SAM superfamily)|nr:radical SAM protein [Treponema sp.]